MYLKYVFRRRVPFHYSDVMMHAMASQITGVSIVCSTFGSGADQRIHQSSASLAFVREIRRWPVNSPHKRPVTRKIFPFDDVIMSKDQWVNISSAGRSCISDPGFVISGGVDLLETKLTVRTERWLQNYTCFIHSFIGFPIYVNLLDRMTSLKWPTGWHEISWHFECTLR